MKRSHMLIAVLVPALVIAIAAPMALASGGGSGRQLPFNLPSLAAGMKGANENPPADLDAAGYAVVDVHILQGEVCVEDFAVGGAAPLILFHIHKGGPTENGPVVVNFVPLLPSGIGCVPVTDRALLRDIELHPGDYYVNAHTGEFPAGALRGQLVRTLPF